MERSKHTNWVVVFKSLTTIHSVMNYGNERFTQYIASNNYSFNLSGFNDKTSQQGKREISTIEFVSNKLN